ncbi:hypothetical protein HDU79_005308 [Rhizoclosmatium sp. JEL0117]|nr:hypothetical protein HDU79_005308 [Rhizoclosmatium sp. JEL0117]
MKGKSKSKSTAVAKTRPRKSKAEKQEQRLLRSGGGSGNSERMDSMEKYDIHEVSSVESDDDEDLDDEEAFNDSDEERFGSHFVKLDSIGSKAASKNKNKNNFENNNSDDDLLNEAGPKRKRDLSEDEEEEDEEEDWGSDDGEMVDIADLLSSGPAKAVPVNPSYALKKKQAAKDTSDPAHILLAKHEDDEDSDDDDDDEEDDDLYASDDAETNDNDQIQSFVSSLDSKGKPDAKKRKVRIEEATEAYEESEFNLNSRTSKTSSAGNAKLDFTDLMGTVGGDAAFLNLRKQLTELAPGTENAGKPGLRAAGTEAAPLPTRIQDRIGREAAYEASKKEIEKWQGIIQKNRKADQLDFSTTTFGESASAVVSSAALVSQFKPQTDMEQEIAKILQDSALNEKKQMELEDLEMNKLSPEEIAAKRQELVRLRSLAFYAEQKAKKVAKIKSKTYRKIHKKDAMRKAAKEGGGEMSLEELNELDPEAAREKAEKLHTDRIKERMTLKHKSTGKWARKMLSRGDRDDETRQALMDQLNQSQTLTRKIAGLESDEDSDALNESDTEDALASSRQRLADLEDQIGEDLEKAVPKKGLYAMKFMQRGLEKQMKESREMLAEARRELEEEGVGYDSDEDDAPKVVKKKIVPVKAGVGRMVFGGEEEELDGGADDDGEEDGEDVDGGNQISSAQFNVKMAKPLSIGKGGESFAVSKSKDSTFSAKISNAVFGDDPTASKPTKKGKASKQVPVVESTPDISAPAPSKPSKQSANKTKDDDESNPWLTVTATTKKSTKAGKDTHTDKALDKMNKVKQLQKASETIADLDVTLNLDGVRKLEVVKPTTTPTIPTPSTSSKKEKPAPNKIVVMGPVKPGAPKPKPAQLLPDPKPKPKPTISYDSDQDSDDAATYTKIANNFVHASDVATLTQRELMQIAFAGDNVAAEFEEEKRKVEEADAPEVVDATLPGWGSWAGNGVEPKVGLITEVKKKAGSIEKEKRKDSKLKDVIINEKRARKSTKYLAKDLPFGYESREQYEQAIRMPLGVEWNTSASHAKLTAPKVVTKMGTIINPLRLAAANTGQKKRSEKESDFKTKK